MTGFKNLRISNTERFLEKMQAKKLKSVEVQFFDARYIASWQHLYFAALNALTAFKSKGNICENMAMEILLYASAQRQIRKAVKLLGITPRTAEMALLIIGDTPEEAESALFTIAASVGAQQDDSVLELSNEKMKIVQKRFGISNSELKAIVREYDLRKALVNLVIERMALLATQR
jgi:tRNA threonylcarbamoyladenosine modification (KEOPS) complex Cgi121 subunit